MSWRTVVIQESKDRLSKIDWNFCLHDDAIIYMCWVYFYERPTTRHKYKIIKRWESIDQRNNDIDKPEIPIIVKEVICQRIMHEITFE
jgi:hypothetical protein